MTSDEFLQMMRNVNKASDYAGGVKLLAEFKDAGGTRSDAYQLLASLMGESNVNEDLVMDLLDIVTGWCYPSKRIWEGQYRPD